MNQCSGNVFRENGNSGSKGFQ
jgi:hypothetical protein